EFDASSFEVMYAATSYCFDLSMYEFFYPLSIGKPVRVLDSALSIPDYLHRDSKVLLNTVPSVVAGLLQNGQDWSSVSVLNMAGEPIPEATIAQLNDGKIEIRNLYGPSETTTYSSCYRFEAGSDRVSIGKPIANTCIYILDAHKQPLPVGVAGELYISGSGLTGGYLNQPGLTIERFIDNPFRTGEKLYKTGDIGRWNADGTITYIGRSDYQVKIRGYRIELGEIEHALQGIEGIKESVVDVYEEQEGQKSLIAYLVGEVEDQYEIREYLHGCLPQYMVPAHYIFLDHLPLTSNGKLDRKALPSPDGIQHQQAYVAPATALEESLTAIWEEVLNRDRVGVTDNFFDLGGHSLKATRVVSQVYKQLGLEVSLRELYNHPKISDLALYLSKDNRDEGLKVNLNNIKAGLPNLYFIPPILGSTTIFSELTQKLNGYFNCYGFQYKGFDSQQAFDRSIEAMANSFIEEIDTQDKDREIIIMGYSMGAAIAFEMTRLLEAQGHQVKLILVDRGVGKKGTRKGNVPLVDEKVLNSLVEQELGYWLKEIRPGYEARVKSLINHNVKILDKYLVSGKVMAPIIAIEAKNNISQAGMKEWRAFTSAEFKHYFIESDHYGIFQKQNLDEVTGLLLPLVAERNKLL
ncbi:AMP-binding protein, partial [Fulvivirga kasyanovii]|uniref:AMP-binding protein n=1 Tax=Fulvivirga kasyanovii TaxID=396812 RepID=UPI0031D45A33